MKQMMLFSRSYAHISYLKQTHHKLFGIKTVLLLFAAAAAAALPLLPTQLSKRELEKSVCEHEK